MKAVCVNNTIGEKTYDLTIGKIYEVQLIKNSFIGSGGRVLTKTKDSDPFYWECIIYEKTSSNRRYKIIMPFNTFISEKEYRNQRIEQLLK
jgi:hypothetical protein